MKFPRQARIFRGPLDVAPVAAVLMLLLIFMLLASLLYTPGVLIQIPDGDALTVTDNPTVVVAVDSGGQCFFDNRLVDEAELKALLKSRLQSTLLQSKKLVMVLWADKAAANQVITRLEALARAAGITEVLLAERPAAFGPQQ
ncbi:MAG TPA: biopolymer transporter ExbD [Candidatus Baltobacteraceae bacterium]|jgi:biopolymer transport protein ExbD|nr:biopolymer transporter ExbD [Candidatus Baltobacteraceae bacterium]